MSMEDQTGRDRYVERKRLSFLVADGLTDQEASGSPGLLIALHAAPVN